MHFMTRPPPLRECVPSHVSVRLLYVCMYAPIFESLDLESYFCVQV